LPWIEKIFQKMASRYGARFADAWHGCDLEVVKADWADDLAGYMPSEIAAGLDRMKAKPFPPTCPEFLLLCRPALDPDTAYHEAVREYRKRFDKGDDTWSRPEIFWAAQTIGHHDLMNTPYDRMRGRWRDALTNAKRDPIPERLVALPASGEVRADPEHVKRLMADLDRKMRRRPETKVNSLSEADRQAMEEAEREIERRQARE
jgi:hypothetical protein